MKLRGKLILSCTALAAVATTAFSTTYAWYTSNSVVTATGIQASTAAAQSDALQISLNGNAWGATVDLTSVLASAKSLTPVDRTANNKAVGTYKLWNPEGNAVSDTEATAGSNYVQFDLYFRNLGQASTVQIAGTVVTNVSKVNAASALPTQKTLADIGTYTAADHPTYTVDLLRALDLEIAASTIVIDEDLPVTVSSIDTNTVTSWTALDTKIYSLHNHHVSTSGAFTVDTLDGNNTANAHAYYNAVKGLTDTAALPTDGTGVAADKQIDTAFAPTGDAMIKLADTTTQTIVKTTWTIYLNGWDKACFDACRGQDITMSLTFNAVTA